MSTGAKIACSDVARNVEVEEKFVSGLEMSDVNVVADVANVAAVDCNVGGVEVSGDGDSAVEQFKNQELGLESEGMTVGSIVLETSGIVHESMGVSGDEVKAVKDGVNVEVDPPVVVASNVVVQDVEEVDVKSSEEVYDVGSGLECAIKPADMAVTPSFSRSDEVMVNVGSVSVDGSESFGEGQAVVDGSGKVCEDLGSQATGDEFVHNILAENRSAEDMESETRVQNLDSSDEVKESDVNDARVGDRSTLRVSNTILNSGVLIEFVSIGLHDTPSSSTQNEEVKDINSIQTNELSDGEITDATDAQNEEVEVSDNDFLIKVHRFEDDTLRDQIRRLQELIDQKTQLRDTLRSEILEKRARMRALYETFDAVKLEELAARRLIRSKRQEIESVQAIIDRVKNAMSVDDIDARINNIERMIQHETLLLRDETLYIREINRLKSLRDQLASNIGSPEEIQQAITMKGHNEERMKSLRKELDPLKDMVLEIEGRLKLIIKDYEEESEKERELKAKFRAADNVHQKAYARLNSLKKLSYDKNANFRQFKKNLTTAWDFALRGDKDALHQLCANQVETFMEQWNNNDEFRKEYVSRCNMMANRRQRAMDGDPLVPDDELAVHLSNTDVDLDRSSVSIEGEAKYVSVDLPVEQGKDVSFSMSVENVSGHKTHELKKKGVAKPTDLGSDDMAKEETELAVPAELAENILTNEEIELSRKAEELREADIAAKLKEQRRLEEKVKAAEALERKQRNAEKAQHRAELRARKEAEQKEKEREKRLRKKEKKKTGDEADNGEEAASLESSNEAATKETETAVNKKKTQKPPAHFFSRQLKPKPVPQQLINRNKKRWQQYGQIAIGVFVIIFLVVFANYVLSDDFKPRRFNVPRWLRYELTSGGLVWNWDWSPVPAHIVEVPSGSCDSWVWEACDDGRFSMKILQKIIKLN
ncbi:hypothetical protein QVD17_11849 [Tagetes erecta]|uniref:Proton pump-interactor 1 n=1 Tax=Tagetes erecta TaxID=13708 RepID=A0AAD8KU73_TARER|nr:hypothetical protein QVD17_11849 [Tagetes erecta]